MICWSQGGEGTVLEMHDDDRITVRSNRASAPGTRLDGRLPSGRSARLKVARCRADGAAFLIDGKLMDASGPSRDEMARLCRANRSGPPDPT
jgi:hypothetical protein